MEDAHCSAQANVVLRFHDLHWLTQTTNDDNNTEKRDEPTTLINTKMNLKSGNNCRYIKRVCHNNNARSERISTCLRSECKARGKKSLTRLIQMSSMLSSRQMKHKRHKNQRQTMEAVSIISLPVFCYLSSLLAIWFLMLNCVCRMPTMVESARLPDIYWNSSNPIFRIDNTDHIFDVNKKQHDHDQVDLVCPSSSSAPSSGLPAGSNNSPNETNSQERYIIYSVSKEEYDTCRLNSNQARVVAVCDQQANGKNRPPFTVTFRSFTPQPNGLEFKAGQDYYFISALIDYQNDQHKRFSPCREQNMKVIFKVCCKSSSLSSNGGTGGNSVSSAQVPSNNRPPQASLLPPNNQAPRTVTPAPTRRPPVITLRPSLVPPHQAPGAAPKMGTLEEFLRTMTPNFNPANQQQQPITVLPIEVLQPSEPQLQVSSTTTSTTTTTQTPDERNDIVLNEQPPSTSPSSPSAQSPFRMPPLRPDTRNPSPFLPFDPTAPPDMIQRYKPTPLPPDLVHPKLHLPSVYPTRLRPTSQPSPQIEPSPWQLPDHRGNQMNRLYPGQHQTANRNKFYPPSIWPHYEHQAPSRDLIPGLDQQQQQPASSASLRVGSLTALVPCLLALALLVLYLNHRTKRAQLASIR